MLTFRALNRDSLSDEDAPVIRKEAQEEIALDLYNSALRFQYDGQFDESETVLKQLLKENISQLESQGGLPSTISTLKYSCYANLGKIAQKKGDAKEALENYLAASELDKKDVSLWYNIGKLSLQLDKFRQASCAFSHGLECSESHWPCLDQLIVVLYAVRDTASCLYYITKALILDPHYVRGLVLRKRIYEANPFTEEYYKLYNPDYVLEPELYVKIDEAEEKECLEYVRKLCDRIDEVEKGLASEPLPCVSMPTPLTEYTWATLGCVIIELHKHISDNNMSHFCKIDLIKCIKEGEVERANFSEPGRATFAVANRDVEVKSETDVETKVAEEEEQNVERRMSTNSENNGDVNDSGVENINSSQAEDNDEMDLDTEDQEENTDQQKADKKRGTKRRRDLLLDLQVWGWHSKRKSVKKGKSEKDLTIEDALKRIIPPHLLPHGFHAEKSNSSCDDSFDTSDMCRMFVDRYRTASCVSPIGSPDRGDKDEYFGSQFERDDVIKFWTKRRECCDAVSLVEDYVHSLGLLWQHKWPIKLISIYIEAYNMYREHFEHPQLYRSETTFEELRNDAWATVLYGELLLYRPSDKNSKVEEEVHPTSLGHLQLLGVREDIWEDDYTLFFIRVHWLRAHIFRKSNKNNLAVHFLQLVEEMISLAENRTERKFRLTFYNSEKYTFVTAEITRKLLRHLEMIDSLSRLEQLYNSRCYAEVADILETTFVSCAGPPTSGRMDRPTQLAMLMDSLWYTDKSRCFVWTERCLQEAVDHFVKPQKDKDRWALILDKCFEVMHQIILEETISIVDELTEDRKLTLIHSLCRTVCHQLNLLGIASSPLRSVVPWIVLHFILLREEHKEQARNVVSHVRKKTKSSFSECETAENRDRPVPPSVAILFSAHDFLGRKGWCLATQGKLLHFMIDTILDRLDTPIFESLRDKIDIHLEQAFFCLYQHPSKKNKVSRHLADHNVSPLPLSWERAQQLYEFNCPYVLPEFDSFKSISISSELEQLFQRIIALVPSECDPQPFVSKISDFVNGTSIELPLSVRFPNKSRSIYYLLGDYYFKQNEIARSVKYFYLDLCINPVRLDTWADLALGTASQIENKLNHCERFKNESDFLDKSRSARVCFRRALDIVPTHVTLWIEFGAFEYMVHSFCSRVLKYESDTFSMEKFEVLENQKESYLDSAGNSFTRALDLYQPEQTEADERWLHHYMLGKVAEKRRKEPVDYLQHYLTAAALLSENNAAYPEKINYHNPQHLSVEALEIHYRIHASILKFLELHEGKNILSGTGRMFKKCLDTSKLYETTTKFVEPVSARPDDFQVIVKCVNDMLDEVENKERATTQKEVVASSDANDEKPPKCNVQELMDVMMRQAMEKEQIHDTDSDATNIDQDDKDVRQIKKTESVRKSLEETTTASSSSSESSSSDSESEDSSSSSSTMSSENDNVYLSDSDVLNVMDRCIVGLEQCMVRFPQNYKALYRLVHLYFNYKAKRDLVRCKQLLLGEYKCKSGVTVSGLFAEHKANNFFNGVWRIPSSEIDRPGSLGAHMARCVTILLQVLRQNNDHKMLLDVCLQLRRTPDADKIYMRHSEREQLSEQSLSLCVQALRTQTKTVGAAGAVQKLMLEIFRSYQRVQKHIPQKEGIFAGMLGDIYKRSQQDKPLDNVNVLEMAVKHCQQHKTTEKLKQQQPKQNVTAVLVPPPVVLPTPAAAAAPSNANQPLKRPTLGRPRGRPPGPKQPGSCRSPRGRGAAPSSGTYSWQNMMYDQKTMNYMLKYQEELLRQYNALSKMNEINFQTQFAQFTVPSVKTPPPNPSQLVQVFGQMTNANLNSMAANQNLGQNLSNLNPSLLKKLIDRYATTSKPNLSTSGWLAADYASKAATKPTYATAGFSKNLPQTSAYKYPAGELPKAKGQETVTINLPITEEKKMSLPSVKPSTSQTDYLSAASMLKERSNLTITPVAHANIIAPPLKLSGAGAGKTLQEKLADKQKRHNLSVEGKINEKGKGQLTSTFSTQPSSKPHVNLPSFSLDSGISISQVSIPKTSRSSEQPAWDFGNKKLNSTKKKGSSSSSSAPKTAAPPYNLPPNTPLSVSVVKKPKATRPQQNPPSDDDVIIIE